MVVIVNKEICRYAIEPVVNEKVEISVRVELSEIGYTFLPSFALGEFGIDLYTRLGKLTTIPGIEPVQHLRPKENTTAGPNTYSGNFGLREFPLHTDLAHWYVPPRYLVLRCVVGSENVKTRICDSRELYDRFPYELLHGTLVRPRRPLAGERSALRLLTRTNGDLRFRWDSTFIAAADSVSARTIEGIHAFLCHEATCQNIGLTNPGDTLILDNWRMLHGRTSVGPTDAYRHLERVYLSEICA